MASRQTESRADFAARCGVTKAHITQMCRKGGRLELACVGQRIDIGHEVARAYMDKRGALPKGKAAKKTAGKKASKKKLAGGGETDEEFGERVRNNFPEIGSYLHLTLKQLVDLHGTKTALKDWVNIRKMLADTHKVELANAERQGQIISREFVQTHLIGLLEELSRRMIADASRTIVQRCYSLAKSDAPIEEAEAVVRGILGQNVKKTKDGIVRKIRRAIRGGAARSSDLADRAD